MPQLNRYQSMRIAHDFLTRCFAKGESIAFLLRRENPSSVTQRVVLLERAVALRYLGWLADENSSGTNIYVAANPLRAGSRKRTKESIAAVRHLYIDIDNDGENRLAALRASNTVPAPTAILSTSPNKYQVLWRVEGFEFESQESTLKLLALTFGGDAACTDCNRVLRVPGFLNLKYDPAHLVAVEYSNNKTWNPSDFKLDVSAAEAKVYDRPIPRGVQPRKQSNSELDWAWVLDELACGKGSAKLTQELASRRSDKPTPLYYARRTVDVASALLWLTEGICLDDVATMLKIRRRFEIPSSLCSARAHEIALTAQRMITRRKSA